MVQCSQCSKPVKGECKDSICSTKTMWSSGIAFSSHIREYSCNKKKESYTFEDQVFDTVTHYVPPCEDSEVDTVDIFG